MPREARPKGPKIITHREPDARKERCQVCKQTMERVTPGHLREHGLSIARYERMYGARRAPSRAERGSVSDPTDPPTDLIATVGERLTESKVWIACLADEVGERMLNGPLRHRLTAMLATMLHQRARVHGEAIAILSSALEEVRQEWRTTHGGAGGGPTDTDTLLRMIDRAAKLVESSEDAVQRTIKLALEEQKAAHQYADNMGPTLYTGTGEKLDMPAGLPASDRETMRNLLALIGKAANERGTLDAEVVERGDAHTSVPGDAQAPSPTPHPSPLVDDDGHTRVPGDAHRDPREFAQGNEPPTPLPHPAPGGPTTPAGAPHPPGPGKRTATRTRGSVTDPTASTATASTSTPTPSRRPHPRPLDADEPVNDPGPRSAQAGGPAQHRKSVSEVQGVGPGGHRQGAPDEGGGDGSDTPSPADASLGEPGRKRRGGPRPPGDGGRAKREKHRQEWQAFRAAEQTAKVGKGRKGKRGPNRGNDRGGRRA